MTTISLFAAAVAFIAALALALILIFVGWRVVPSVVFSIGIGWALGSGIVLIAGAIR